MDTASIKVMTRDLPNLDLADFLAGVDGAEDRETKKYEWEPSMLFMEAISAP